ncbi:murein biosynthesis integral membrane protein MurJ [Hyphomicrobium sp.]|jgi:putative peptidoglycan lipid II flippase|uniref:murein biosynthesis integral membrane protein MurJ n=1 Tax=Hyphomicrobium sp. TaxID=82 RepID=UPI002CEE556A|nr:murein biosynthesis integral membrane protein MurJ [Hyphomicrobium sp.]HVZ05954.1 murein biosynthesis integral membrane protein MurJ [Hyphomicrobium sp.]
MKLYKSFATVGGLTLLSRVFGFVRDILIAATLGSGWVADAFVVAFRFPNLFRRLFGEGAFNSAFVPIFAKKMEGEGHEAARTFAEEAMAGLLLILLIVTIIAELAMPFFMYGLAPGFDATPEKFDLSVLLTRITMPYLLCMSLVALMSGALNSVGRFAESASVSIVLNGVMMIATFISLWLGYRSEPAAGVIQAWAVFVAGFLQLALLMWGMRQAKLTLGLRRPRLSPDIRRLVKLGVPGIISGGVTQINVAIGTVIASLQAGAVSQLYYADRIYQLPLAIVGIAVGIVLLPDISRQLRAGNTAGVMDSQNRSLEFAMLLTIPSTLALAVIPYDIVGVLFQRGAFKAADTAATAQLLAVFALGLPGFVMIKIFSPAYFAHEDTKTPMQYAAISLIANTLGAIALFFIFRSQGIMPQLGIAIATTFGGWLNAYLLWITLHRRGDFIADARLRRNIPLIILASLAMAGVLLVASYHLAPYLSADKPFLVKFSGLMLEIAVGMAVFGLIVAATGVLSLRQLARFTGRGGKA